MYTLDIGPLAYSDKLSPMLKMHTKKKGPSIRPKFFHPTKIAQVKQTLTSVFFLAHYFK